MPVTQDVKSALGDIAASAIMDATENEKHAIGDLVPDVVLRPETTEDVSAALRWANENGLAVVPWGNATLMHLGNPPVRYDVALKLDLLNKVIDYPAADMTITAGAGLCLGCLQKILAAEGQYLPIHTANEKDATVGGLIATNAGGALRFREGTLRDMLLGLKIVLPDGRIIKGGSKVVKNVAGYDLCKLFTGSYGTLGVIVEVTIRLRPRHEEESTLWCEFAGHDDAEGAVSAILDSEIEPVFIEYLNSTAAREIGPDVDGWAETRPVLLLGLDGNAEAADWQKGQVRALLGPGQADRTLLLEDEIQDEVRQMLFSFCAPEETCFIGKANLLSSNVTSFIKEAEKAAAEREIEIAAASHIANGIVYLKIQSKCPDEGVVDLVSTFTRHAVHMGGSFVVEHASPNVKKKVEVWGPVRGDLGLMKSIKETLDPNRSLNPGRFVGGI
ncbi:MAG: FAD-binding oxidoreductase [Planctomycetota bacterium]|nr:FAD-binding oxidoreductase [Planctomycetota bacterium]MDP7252099.1 FAD-binding oxidoreductase [Planctomycetota bacterium]